MTETSLPRTIFVSNQRISVVTPTLSRPEEVAGLVKNLQGETIGIFELILIDGSSREDRRTEDLAHSISTVVPFQVRYIRQSGGTAIQRNTGIDAAAGEYVALVDDDIRLEPSFFENALNVLEDKAHGDIGAVTGYISNQKLDPETSPRWRLYRKLGLFTTYEPGRYDYHVGYPINRYLQPPHDGIREIDFMGAGCAVWRAEVFQGGLRFDEFFSGFGVLEDAHLALRAKKNWRLVESGLARCIHLKTETSRENGFSIGKKSAVNYRYVFMDVVPDRSLRQEARFWLVQFVDLLRIAVSTFRGGGFTALQTTLGKVAGIAEALVMREPDRPAKDPLVRPKA